MHDLEVQAFENLEKPPMKIVKIVPYVQIGGM